MSKSKTSEQSQSNTESNVSMDTVDSSKNSTVVEAAVVKGNTEVDIENIIEEEHPDTLEELAELVEDDSNEANDDNKTIEDLELGTKDTDDSSDTDNSSKDTDKTDKTSAQDESATSKEQPEAAKATEKTTASKKVTATVRKSTSDNEIKDDSSSEQITYKVSNTMTTSSKNSDNIGYGSIDTPRRVAILGGNRIPFARSNGPYIDASNIDMLTAALNGLVERFDLQGEKVGEVVAGAVLKLSRDLNLTRESVLNTALAPETPAYDVSQACGTGLQSAFAAANKIALGVIDSAITGGVDTTSDAPIALGDGLRKVLLKVNAARTNADRLKALLEIDVKDLIDAPKNGEPRTGMSMGEHQAVTTLEWGITREAQDELAVNSHKNLARAYEDGFFDDLMTPYKGLTRDQNLRPDSNIEKLSKLKPVFGKNNANPTMTAANSTPLSDGASCVLLACEDWAKEKGLEVLAYIVHQETAAVDFVDKKEGLLMAPAYAVPRMLDRAGLTLQDFDFYEIHEAFAGQVLSTLAAWEDETFCKERLGRDSALGSIDRSKLNVNGSSLAAGHPFAATGGRILASTAKLLNQNGGGRALVSICAAGGQGVTAIVEK